MMTAQDLAEVKAVIETINGLNVNMTALTNEQAIRAKAIELVGVPLQHSAELFWRNVASVEAYLREGKTP